MAIVSYKNQATKDIAEGIVTAKNRKILPLFLHKIARKKLAFIDSVGSVLDLRTAPKGYGWEILKGDRKGQSSVRINDQYRICFHYNGKDCENVEVIDYH